MLCAWVRIPPSSTDFFFFAFCVLLTFLHLEVIRFRYNSAIRRHGPASSLSHHHHNIHSFFISTNQKVKLCPQEADQRRPSHSLQTVLRPGLIPLDLDPPPGLGQGHPFLERLLFEMPTTTRPEVASTRSSWYLD